MSKLDLEARMTIKTLIARKVSQSETARLLGVSEGTIRYHIRRMRSGSIDGRANKPQRADPFGDAIRHWRSCHKEDGMNLTVLYEWLVQEHGYTGSLRSVQRYCHRTFSPPKIRSRRRVETPAGAQTQVDWASFPRVILGGMHVDLLCLRMVLSYSRYEAIVWSLRKDLLSWLQCHTHAFRRLGGVTATLRVDNEKTAIVEGAGAWGTIHPAYRRYAQMLRFHVDACQPREPQAKGKVERSVRTQRFSADPRAHAWRDLEELQAWSDERVGASAQRRRCPITGTTVLEAWEIERPLLTQLPETLPDPFDVAVTRRVSIDCLVSFEGRQYSVPFAFVGRSVEVRGCASAVQVVADAEIVAVHLRHTAERLVLNPSHYEGPSTERVHAPAPLGRMGRRMIELGTEPVVHRSIDLYHQLAEVAR